MNYFFSDDHYGVNPGRHIFELLPEDFRKETVFTENSWSLLESGEWVKEYSFRLCTPLCWCT